MNPCKKSWKKGNNSVKPICFICKLAVFFYFFSMSKYFSLPLLLFCFITTANSQQRVADSLERLIIPMPNDTTKVNRLNDLVPKLQFVNPAKAATVVAEAIQLSEKLNYSLGRAIAYRLRGVLYVDRGLLDSGKLFYDKAYELVKDNKEKAFRRQMGMLTHNYGVIYHQRQQNDSATANYLKAVSIYKEIGEEGLSFSPYNNLSTLFTFLKDHKKALSYAIEASAAAEILGDESKKVLAVNGEAAIRIMLQQYDGLLPRLKTNLQRAKSLDNIYACGKAANLIAQYFNEAKTQYDSAIFYHKIALEYLLKLNYPYDLALAYGNLGYDYRSKSDWDNAKTYLKKGMAVAEDAGLDQLSQMIVAHLVDVEELHGNIQGAYGYLKKYVSITDSLQRKNNRIQMNELDAKYQAEKKEAQINQLETEKKLQQLNIRQKNVLNYIFIASALVLLIISLLSYRNYRQKQRIQQQRIAELETEKKLAATEAVLKGEEQERTRLAKDLHDGLGGMLSGIKHSFTTMKGNLIMTPDNQQAFERSMDMLDSSIKEMRRVAHNLMPEALVKFGLDTALQDFCTDISQSRALNVSYQSMGIANVAIDQTVSITIYRIVQELINNTIKHASAKTAIIQITKDNNLISVTVEDDGKGFDTSILKGSPGIGWSNIRSRIDFLKGTIDVQAEQGQGTSVHIELNT